ncbi:MAG: hypothetical protein JEZ04_09740 [Spirochaetales bacterium]|nr:hypothetical protein [Spirochaetales bacterium]
MNLNRYSKIFIIAFFVSTSAVFAAYPRSILLNWDPDVIILLNGADIDAGL